VLLEPDGSIHSTIEFKSGDNPDSLRGFAVNFVVIDEAARVPYESFISVMTTLTQTRGRAIIISTPNGRGWFYDVYQRGVKFTQDGTPLLLPGQVDKWYEVVLPATANVDQPTVKKESIEEMRRNLPEQVFRQEVAAMFLNDSAGVFQYIRECIMAGPLTEAPLPGRRYVMGIDLARVEDLHRHHGGRHCSQAYRAPSTLQEIGWQIQYYRIIEISQLYNNAYFMLDSTGLGDPIYDALINAGLNGEPYKLSNQSKQALMEKLRINS
jgi:hypothetical protein